MLQLVGSTAKDGRPQVAKQQQNVAQARRQAAVVMNDLLGHTVALGLQARRLRWHAVSPQYAMLREMLRHLVLDLETYGDRAAQRAVHLGAMAEGHIDARVATDASNHRGIPEHRPFVMAALGLLTLAVASAAAQARHNMQTVAALGDPVSEGVVGEVASGFEMWAWCLEIQLEALTDN